VSPDGAHKKGVPTGRKGVKAGASSVRKRGHRRVPQNREVPHHKGREGKERGPESRGAQFISTKKGGKRRRRNPPSVSLIVTPGDLPSGGTGAPVDSLPAKTHSGGGVPVRTREKAPDQDLPVERGEPFHREPARGK